jgi:glycosyltransferase involved in cell wall biosynthesis
MPEPDGGSVVDGLGSPIRPRRALRVLVVTNLYPTPAHPAFGTFVGARVDALRRAGATVAVAAITDPAAHRDVARKYLRLALGAGRTVLAARLRRRPYDVVEAHIAFPTGLVAWPVAALGGARLSLFCHGSDVTTLPWSSRRRALLARRLFARADLVFANSRYLAGVAEERLGPLRRPATVVSPGIDLGHDDADSIPDRESDHVLFVGRLVPGKGADVLLDAFGGLLARRPAARLTIVGDGPERAGLEARAHQLAAPVEFRGSLAPAVVADLLRRSSVVAVPSTVPEGLGLIALEAMARGAIVVATVCGGLAETMRDGDNGFVVPPGDVEALATALHEALETAERPAGERLRDAGRATAAAHDLDTAVRASLDRYAELIA